MNFDFYLFHLLNQFAGRCRCSDWLGIFFAGYFEYILILFLLLFLAKDLKKYWTMVAKGLISAVISRFVFVEAIRVILPRPRPFVGNNVNLLIQKLNQSAFPSGHAAFYFALSTIFYFYNKKAGILFFLASFLITLSRVFVGVHWPSDIVAGAIVGVLTACLVNHLFQKFSSAAGSEKTSSRE